MTPSIIYTVENLSQAREFLLKFSDPIVLINKRGSTRYYGILILDYIFKKLLKEFPQINKIIIHVGDDHAALFSAIRLGYKNIIYTGESEAAKNFLNNNTGYN
ncbi:hypothetical protein [Candidatus Tisiphia endosymbiont of Nemotelus uliginosus]|uniref:hypothetical protein n=1 Tax=Candidatus Tisiphia endosymbiont of Nemotelus uliginosus TaxID=3077926 RepID=UPI0035C8C866